MDSFRSHSYDRHAERHSDWALQQGLHGLSKNVSVSTNQVDQSSKRWDLPAGPNPGAPGRKSSEATVESRSKSLPRPRMESKSGNVSEHENTNVNRRLSESGEPRKHGNVRSDHPIPGRARSLTSSRKWHEELGGRPQEIQGLPAAPTGMIELQEIPTLGGRPLFGEAAQSQQDRASTETGAGSIRSNSPGRSEQSPSPQNMAGTEEDSKRYKKFSKVALFDKVAGFFPSTRRPHPDENDRPLQETCANAPYFIIFACMIQLGVAAFGYCGNPVDIPGNFNSTNLLCDYLEYDPKRRLEVWRLFTSMLVHSSPYHLMVNMVTQFIMGIPLELVHKSWRVAIVYIGGGVIGCIGGSMAEPKYKLVGASSGIYALLSANFAAVITNWNRMGCPCSLSRIQSLPCMKSGYCARICGCVLSPAGIRLTLLILYVAATEGPAHLQAAAGDENTGPVSHYSHLAGAIGGLVFSVGFLTRSVRILKWICLGVVVEFLAFAIYQNIVGSEYPKA